MNSMIRLMTLVLMSTTLISAKAVATTLSPTAVCAEEATGAIIDALEAAEPKSELHILKDAKDAIDGIVDINKVYSTFDMVTIGGKDETRTIEFSNGDLGAFASFKVIAADGKIECQDIVAWTVKTSSLTEVKRGDSGPAKGTWTCYATGVRRVGGPAPDIYQRTSGNGRDQHEAFSRAMQNCYSFGLQMCMIDNCLQY